MLKGWRNYLVVRNTGKTLKTSVFNEVRQVIKDWEVSPLFKINKSDLTITTVNGYQAIFKGLDDPEKIKSIVPETGVLTDIWIEEATETSRDAFLQLTKRLRGKVPRGVRKRITLTFNPILKNHWIFKEFFSGLWTDTENHVFNNKVSILKSTYKDNIFLDQDDIDRLEDETDTYYYDVYTLGNWGVLGDLIFRNWRIEDVLGNEELVKTFDRFKHGLDFGFTNDPTAYNKLYYHRALKRLYVLQEVNGRNLTNDKIVDEIRPFVDGDQVVCDSAEPKSIAEINALGLSAVGARKGKDSIIHGIQWLQKLEVIIDRRCQKTINDFQLYQWKKDKDGEVTNTPIDKNNHHPDAIRYAMEDEMLIVQDDEPEEVGDIIQVDW